MTTVETGAARRVAEGQSAGRALMRRLVTTTALSLVAASQLPAAIMAQPIEQSIGISIPSQPLPSAIAAFIAQTGWQVSYASALASRVVANAVSGPLAPEAALRQLVAGTGLSVSVTGPASAALTGAPVNTEVSAITGADITMLDRLIITGERATRDYFSTYTSVGVVDSNLIATHNIQSVADAMSLMANVRAFNNDGGDSSIAIRGLSAEGLTQPDRMQPVISSVVDGAFQNIEAMRRGTNGIWDVSQVEVLRGPQSTLHGRNSLAGTIIVETNDPTWEPEIIAEGIGGTQDLWSLAGVISGPILEDQVAFRVAGQVKRESSDINFTNPTIAGLGKSELEDFRAKLLIEPDAIPELSALFTVSYTHDKPKWSTVSGPDFFARQYNGGISAEFRDTSVARYVGDISYELTPNWTVRSITALSTTHTTITSKLDPTQLVSLDRDDTRNGLDFTQDLTATYESPDSPFSGVFGLFAGRSTMDYNSNMQASIDAFAFGGPGPGVFIINTPFQELVGTNKTDSIAAYADMRYDLTDWLTLQGGGRLLHDTYSTTYSGRVLNTPLTIAGFPVPVHSSLNENTSQSSTEFLPKVGIAFHINPDHTIALTATKGYRPGFSQYIAGSGMVAPTGTVTTVAPETVWTYEAAYRANMLDETVQLGANLFYNDYRNQQIAVDNPEIQGYTYTANAASSFSYGAEIEGRYNPTEFLSFFGAVGLMRTEFTEGVINGVNVSGKEFPEAPTLTAALGVDFKHESGFFAGGKFTFTDGYYSKGDTSNTPARLVDSYGVLDAQIGYEHDNLKVSLFATNLLNAQYLTGIGSGGNLAYVGDSRQVGLKLTGKY